MSLFFEDRIKEDPNPVDNNIIFTYPWIIEIAPQEEELNEELNFCETFITSYQYRTQKWSLDLRNTGIKICDASIRSGEWIDSKCFISYNLFYDDDMRFLLHSSLRTKMAKTPKKDIFQTPDGFMKKFVEAFNKKKLSKAVIHVEIHLPWFYPPFNDPVYKNVCDEYPADMENHYKFAFLKTSDFSIKCPDGAVPASKMLLNATSKFMKTYFKETNGNELTVDFSVDVVKPVIYYLHSVCFEMPNSFDFEYVDRLFEVMDFFKPLNQTDISKAVCLSLGRKFVDELITNFDLILRWLKIAHQYSIYDLADMILPIIAEKYYFKWHQLFPENARNINNPFYRDIFCGPQRQIGNFRNPYLQSLPQYYMCSWMFEKIEDIMTNSFKTNIILP